MPIQHDGVGLNFAALTDPTSRAMLAHLAAHLKTMAWAPWQRRGVKTQERKVGPRR